MHCLYFTNFYHLFTDYLYTVKFNLLGTCFSGFPFTYKFHVHFMHLSSPPHCRMYYEVYDIKKLMLMLIIL